MNEITCVAFGDDDDEDEGMEEDDDGEEADQCEGLRGNACRRTDGCTLNEQSQVCVWDDAPEGQRDFYAIVEWQYLTIDGEETEISWCYEEETSAFANVDEYKEYCVNEERTEDDCVAYGCKSWNTRKGKCKAQKKKVKCKKLGRDLEAEQKEMVCNLYATLGCSWNEKKEKCAGSVDLR